MMNSWISWLEVVDGAQLVEVYGHRVYIWHGGVTVNIYYADEQGDVVAADVFTLYGEGGEPATRDRIEQHIRQHQDYLRSMDETLR